jgi:hypothetical protein
VLKAQIKRRPAMKKISTVGRQRIRNFSELKQAMGKLTIGLDLGDRSSWYCVLENYAGRGIKPKTFFERKVKSPDAEFR